MPSIPELDRGRRSLSSNPTWMTNQLHDSQRHIDDLKTSKDLSQTIKKILIKKI